MATINITLLITNTGVSNVDMKNNMNSKLNLLLICIVENCTNLYFKITNESSLLTNYK